MVLSAAVLCLAMNVYREARGEEVTGQQAVALVTMNRAQWRPKLVCKEVHRPGQFSWTAEPQGRPKERGAWLQAQKVAVEVIGGRVRDFTRGATHFCTKPCRPSWRRKMKYLMTVGGHRFYKPRPSVTTD